MNKFRFGLLYFFGAAIQAYAAFTSKIIFSHNTFTPKPEFFFILLGIFSGLMAASFICVAFVEKVFGCSRLQSHAITVAIFTALAIIYQAWTLGGRNLFKDAIMTLALSMVVNFATLTVRYFYKVRVL